MSATIRQATASDRLAVERLLTESDLPIVGVADLLPTFVVAESEGAIVGVAGLEVCCDNALLRSVAVRPEWRRHGVGRALVSRVIADAEARGINGLYLLTTTAEHYFPTFGFSNVSREAVPDDVRRTEEFNTACPATAIVMARPCCAPV